MCAAVEEEATTATPGDSPLEEALAQLGHFALYQRYCVVLLLLPNLLAAMYSLNYVFVADVVPARCLVPECESWEGAQFESGWSDLPGGTTASCRRHPLLDTAESNGTCRPEHFDLNSTVVCEHVLYQNMDTTFAEFELWCWPWRRTLVGSVRNAALPVALLLTGYLSDGWGRRTAFCVFSACAGLLGGVKALSVNYQMYVTMEFFEAALGYGFTSAAYVMMLEVARPSLRATFACSTGVAYGAGGMLLAAAARGLPYWRHLLLAVHAPALLLPLYWLLLDESPRWLHARGRAADAARIIRKAARWNNIQLDEQLMKALETESADDKQAIEENPWLSLFKSKALMGRFAVCAWCWVASTFVYYGLTINSVSLAGDKYVNFALNMSMEVVASLLLMMALERFGRRRTIFVAFLVCGVACVTPYFVENARAGVGLFFVGKLGITCAFNSVYVFTAELFPTRARTSALAACSLVGRLGSVLAPQTPLLSLSVQAVAYAAVALSAAGVVLLAPETARVPLLQHAARA